MQLQHGQVHCGSVPVKRRASVVVRSIQGVPSLPDPSQFVGERLGKWMKTPYDLLAFGPRATAGAVVSLPERLQRMQSDVARLQEILRSPAAVEEKRSLVLKEVEETVLEFLERGVTVESDVLANLKAVLPPEAVKLLSELIPAPPNSTVSVESTVVEGEGEPAVTYGQQDVMAMQVASEVSGIQAAAAALRGALDAIRTNEDLSNTNILKLNLKEAKEQLARRLQEVSASTAEDPAVQAAAGEARILLDEVSAVFG